MYDILTKDDEGNIEIKRMPIGSLYKYKSPQLIEQNYRHGTAKLSLDNLLETYVINKK